MASVFLLPSVLSSQPINLKAKRMKSMEVNGHKGQLLRGNVQFEQEGSVVYCDEAIFDPVDDVLRGTGNVKITNTNGTKVTGDRLVYNNASKLARVEGAVKLTDQDLEIETPWLEYQTTSRIGSYGSGAFIKDGENYLKSRVGYYDPNNKQVRFKTNVILETPDYIIQTDTLVYHTEDKVAHFYRYTQINSDKEQIILFKGYYDTDKRKGYFTDGFNYTSNEQHLMADTAIFDETNGFGVAIGNVWMYDSSENAQVWGNRAIYRKGLHWVQVYGNALAVKADKDSMYIYGDTLTVWKDTVKRAQYTQALGSVRLFQKNNAATAGKLLYSSLDSTIRLRGKPVVWDSASRLSGDSINFQIEQKKLRYGSLFYHALIVMKEDSSHYSQIQGDSVFYQMDTQQRIEKSWVYRKGKSVYYIRENNEVTSAVSVESEHMKFAFNQNQIDKVHFYIKPKGAVYPLDQLPDDKRNLDRFIWDIQNKPSKLNQPIPFTPIYINTRYKKIPSIQPQKEEKSFFQFWK
jgi:lipopolysaccharide export system protein LptA